MGRREHLVDTCDQALAVGQGTLWQSLRLAGAEGTRNVIQCGAVGGQKEALDADLGQGLPAKRLEVFPLQGALGPHPGQGCRGRE